MASFTVVSACSTPQPVQTKETSPLRLLIGDGGVRIEESYSHPELDEGRKTAGFESENGKFQASETDLPGVAWVEESSEYMLLPTVNHQTQCRVKISRKKLTRAPAASKEVYTYSINVRVTDGIKGGPFETVINGENEGLIQLGEYPVNNWQSTEDLVINETIVESWFYEADSQRYEIVKRLGEDQFLKKTLKFDPYLKKVTRIQYEILKGSADEVEQQRTVLARLSCQS